MPARTEQLNEGGSVKLDATGAGTVTLQPSGLETWNLTRYAVHTTTNVLEPTAILYVGSVAAVNILDSTYTGSGDSGDTDQQINPAQPLLCVWSGGDVGATATLSVFGTKSYR